MPLTAFNADGRQLNCLAATVAGFPDFCSMTDSVFANILLLLGMPHARAASLDPNP
jgi:hypothetical protein